MKLPSSFDTSISRLLELQNEKTLFLSTWDKDDGYLEFSDTIIRPAIMRYPVLKNKYYFSDELLECKRTLIADSVIPISENNLKNIGIFANGTSAAMLALMSIKEKVSSIRAILISPTYFTYIKVLHDLNSEIYFFPIKIKESSIHLPIDSIEECLERNNINLVILTIPLFGVGLSPHEDKIIELSSILERSKCYFLIDYLYGGMEWSKDNPIENLLLWNLCLNNPYVIFIESLCKRVFLNGIKSAVVGASAEIILQMELKSVYLTGSLSYVQVELLKELYSGENRDFIENQIKLNIDFFRQNYELLNTKCRNTQIQLFPCNEGYFCLAKLLNLSGENGIETAVNILRHSNVMTIPHDRYLFSPSGKYTFRINLSIKKETLFAGIDQLLKLNF